MAGNYLSNPSTQWLDDNGDPLSGGTVDFWEAGGTSVRLDTFTDKDLTGGNENANPVVLASDGRSATAIVLQQLSYNIVVKNSAGVVQTNASRDNVSNILQVDLTGVATIATYAAARALAGATLTDEDKFFIESGAADGDGAEGNFRWDSSSTATDDNGTILKLTDTATGRLLRDFSILQSAFFLPTGNGVANDTTPMQSFANDASKHKLWNTGTYLIDGQLDFGGDLILDQQDIIVDGASISGSLSENAMVLFGGDGSHVALPAFSGTQTKGAHTLLFVSAPSVSEGNSIVIYNATDGSYHGGRTNYRAGEYQKVAEVSGNTITLYGQLRATYSSSVDSFRLDGSEVKVSGKGHYIASGVNNVAGCKALRCLDSEFSGISSSGSDFAAMEVSRCYNVYMDAMNLRQTLTGGGTMQYGLVVGNSENIYARGHFVGNRHGALTGGGDFIGAVPNRNVVIEGYIGNTGDVDIEAANWHGNSENCKFLGVVDGGLAIGGNLNKAEGIIYSRVSGVAVLFSEMKGFSHDLSNVKIIANGNPSSIGRGVIDLAGNSTGVADVNTTEGGTLDFSGMEITAPDAQGNIFEMENKGAVPSQKILLDFSRLKLVEVHASLGNIVKTTVSSGDNFDEANFDGILGAETVGCSLANLDAVRGFRESGTESVTLGTSVVQSDKVITFAREFPRAPKVVATVQTGSVNSVSVSASVVGTPSATGFTVRIRTADSTNFGNTGPLNVEWQAAIDE